jgi:hypothetical protein
VIFVQEISTALIAWRKFDTQERSQSGCRLMKMNPFTCVVASCAILAVTLLAQDNTTPPPVLKLQPKDDLTVSTLKSALRSMAAEQKWQYKQTSPGTNLDKMGRDGWELVIVVNTDSEKTQYWKKTLSN